MIKAQAYSWCARSTRAALEFGLLRSREEIEGHNVGGWVHVSGESAELVDVESDGVAGLEVGVLVRAVQRPASSRMQPVMTAVTANAGSG